jgi:4-hydroxy-3-methylbut-2-en-1-yl diphosphate reductase
VTFNNPTRSGGLRPEIDPAALSGPTARPDGAAWTICAPLRPEARAVRRGLGRSGGAGRHAGDPAVIRTGLGAVKAARRAEGLAREPFGMLVITGVAGALDRELQPGDLVVATEVRPGPGVAGETVSCPSASLLAGELRRAGLTVHTGPLVTTASLAQGADRERLAGNGAIAVDMESAPLAAAAAGRPVAVLRAISDVPGRPLAHPATVTGGLAALRSLRRAAPVLRRWAAAVGDRQVLLAGPRSFCAGVERAIEIVERMLDQNGPPVYVRKQIVHNAHVVGRLAARGAVFVEELEEVPDGAAVVFSAHGVAPSVRDEAARRGLRVVDATCPLVSKVHVEARRFAEQGYQVVLIGHQGHEEVEGTLGEARAARGGPVTLAETARDVARLEPPDPGKVAYLMQTTLAVEEAAEVADAIRARFPHARGPHSEDICYATTNRQRAVRAISQRNGAAGAPGSTGGAVPGAGSAGAGGAGGQDQSAGAVSPGIDTDAADVVLVVGSANSSNSQRLVETSARSGTPAHLVDDVSKIELGWLAGARVVGLTAGASAPPALVDEVIAALGGLGRVEVSERVVATESVTFNLPKEVRQS